MQKTPNAPAVSATALVNRLLARGKFRHVQVLLQLAELGSVQRTADAIGLTQSSVTQTLAYLENLLEVPLFERHTRGVRPTAACRDLLPIARQLLMGLGETADVVVARQREAHSVVRLIGSAAAINGLLVDALPGFPDRHSGIHVHLREAEGGDQLLAITRGDVDLVACREPAIVPEGWVFEAVRSDRFVVICRASHPLARRRAVKCSELGDQTWLAVPAGIAGRAKFDELAESFAAPPRIYPIVSRSIQLWHRLLMAHDLLAFLPINLVRPHLDTRELVEVRVREVLPAIRAIGLMRPVQPAGEAAAKLAAFLREFEAR